MSYFVRTKPAPQVSGDYRSFRSHVREDFRRRCAYCLLGERLSGGEENFELDHFRPKSLFPDLIADFYNLYYACHACNRIKRNLWPPRALEAQGVGFIDLCKEEFLTHFRAAPDGEWVGMTQSGEYTIDKLRLNRKHLVEIRRILKQLGVEAHDRGEFNGELLRVFKQGFPDHE